MKRIIIFTVLAVAAVFAACSNKGIEGTHKTNQSPTVWLSAGPPEGSTGKYRIQMFWGGWDPDGEIAGYEYLVSNNVGSFDPADTVGVPWLPVAGNDSTFTFSADEPVDSLHTDNTKQVDVFTRSHTFFIRAVDREGLRSKTPAYRSFTSRTLSPEVHIERPQVFALNPAAVPQISTYRWKALDWVDDMLLSQDPDSVQYALIPVPLSDGANYEPTIQALQRGEKEQFFQPWVWYKAPEDSGKFWTTPVVNPGKYVFAIRAKDEAGAITPVFNPDDPPSSGSKANVRRVSVGPLTSGPTLTVQNDYIGIIRTTSCSTPTSILDSPAGVPLTFKIQASADSYGGTIAGYRYGWDIPDLNDPEQWEIDITPFLTTANVPPRTFFFGTHTLTMEVVDNSGYCSRVEVKVNIVQFTLERNLLVVDDDVSDEVATAGWSNGGVGPTDLEHDQFWADAAAEVGGFDTVIDMVDTKQRFIPLATLAQYKSIIWDVYGHNTNANASKQPLLYDYISHRLKNPPPGQVASTKLQPNVLALTMAAGGHIMLCGTQPVQEVCSRVYTKGARYPIIFLYELEGKQDGSPNIEEPVGDLSFAYRELCLETLDFALQTTSLRRASKQYCRIDAIRPHGGAATAPREDTMREAFSLDPNFPTLTLRPEAAGPGQWWEPDHFGLDAEVYNPAYFRQGGACQYVPRNTRSCFQPVYGLECIDTLEPTYHQAIAFWTTAFADRVAEVPGAVGARSIVFGFSPVFIKPVEMQKALDYVFFKEWKLPQRTTMRAAGSP